MQSSLTLYLTKREKKKTAFDELQQLMVAAGWAVQVHLVYR